MKTLRFSPNLIPLVLSCEKTSTWRLWDDKNLKKGDKLSLINAENNIHFAYAEIIEIAEKEMGDLTAEDKSGHEKFSSDEEMYETYMKYYQKKVNAKTKVKIVRFKLLKN